MAPKNKFNKGDVVKFSISDWGFGETYRGVIEKFVGNGKYLINSGTSSAIVPVSKISLVRSK